MVPLGVPIIVRGLIRGVVEGTQKGTIILTIPQVAGALGSSNPSACRSAEPAAARMHPASWVACEL